jgi:hypothetical protein
MSETYHIEWTIRGMTKVVADSADEARAKHDRLSVRDLAEEGELEVYAPLTEAAAKIARERLDAFLAGQREDFLNG